MPEISSDGAKLPKVPVQYEDSYDGYEWIEAAGRFGWYVPGVWGRHGWDLGRWPLMVVALYDSDDDNVWAYVTYVEGDTEVHAYDSPIGRDMAVTELAVHWWRNEWADGPDDLPETGYLVHHYGPHKG